MITFICTTEKEKLELIESSHNLFALNQKHGGKETGILLNLWKTPGMIELSEKVVVRSQYDPGKAYTPHKSNKGPRRKRTNG